MNRKINILFIIPSLHAGGSERVFLHLIRNLDREVFSISLILLKKEGILVDFLPSDIQIISYNFSRTSFAVFRIFLAIRKFSPDIVLSTLGHLNLIISLVIPFSKKSTLFIARESSIISHRLKDERYPALFKLLFKTVYHHFHHLICQSRAMKDDLIQNFSLKGDNITVINNPVDFSFVQAYDEKPKKWDDHGRALLSIGQLRKEKGYDRLLAALAKCNEPFTYKIIGDGEMRKKLQEIIADLTLDLKVDLVGSLSNPFGYIAQADCLLLGSFYEGFPNSLLEANAHGVPVLAWAAPGGHNEIIVNGINGWIFQSEEELLKIIETKAYLKLDKQKIISFAKERYELSKIIKEYEHLLVKLYTRRHPKL